MADMIEIESLLGAAAPGALPELDPVAKQSFARVLDYYTDSGYTKAQVLEVVDQQLGSTELVSATAPEFTRAVEDLSDAVLAEQETPGTDADRPAENPSSEEIFAALGAAAGEDFAEAVTEAMPELAATTVTEVWKDVRTAILAEMAAQPEVWRAPGAEDALREAAYYALCDALEGFLAEGESEGLGVALAQLQ
jgi:hypothetical protein